MLADWQVFFTRWLRDPLAVGAVVPANPLVGRTAARWLALHETGWVVELGAGIGSVTQGLLDAGCPADRLVVIEREPAFVRILERRFPGLRIVCGDAGELTTLLNSAGVDRLATVVSCLPIRWFPPALQQSVVEQSFRMLGRDGCLLQLTNASTSPLAHQPPGIAGEPVARVWINFLPILIWRYARDLPRGQGRSPATPPARPAA